MNDNDKIFDDLLKTIEEQPDRNIINYNTETDTSSTPQKTIEPKKGKTKTEKKEPAKQTVRRSNKGEWREINSDLLNKLSEGGFSASELQIILYILWNITADTSRNYINVKRKTIQERTNLSISQANKTTNQLIRRKILIQPVKDNNLMLVFNADHETWS